MISPLLTLAPYNVIASRVAERLAAGRGSRDPLAPWAEEVIVASAGVSQSIAAAMLQHFPNGVAALQLHTIDTLARRIVNAAGTFPRVATDEERRLAMRTAARSISDPLTATRGAAAMLERSYRDVRDSGVTLAEFSQRAGAARSLRNRDRIRTVIKVWQQYERFIAKLEAVDPADVLRRAAEGCAATPPQILAGFYDMTGAQLALIRTLQAVEKIAAVFVPVDDPFAHPFIRHFESSLLTPRSSVLKIKQVRTSVREAQTREEEIHNVCADIAALLASGASAQSIGVVSRSLDAYDAALFERFSREHGFVMSESVALPLTAHRFGRATMLLLRIRERNFPRSDVLEIVRSGLRLTTRINPEKADYETRYATIAGGRSADLRQRTFRSPVVDDYIAVVAELETLTERIDAAWLARLADEFRIETEIDLAAVDELQKIGALFTRAEVWKRPFDQGSLIDALESVSLDREPTTDNRQRIWLGDVMRLRGRSFEHLFAIRMQDDVLPQRRVEDPVLVDADRRILGLREIGDGRAEERLLFDLIGVAASTSIDFSFAASDGFGKPLRRSQFLRHLECGSHAAALPAERRRGRLTPERALQLLVRSGTRGIFDGYLRSDTVRDRAGAALQAITPTQLEDFGECPQKFFLKQILGVRDLDDPEMDMQINHREKGIVLHRILERFYREKADSVEGIVDEEFDKLDEKIPPFNPPMRRIERQATKRLLRQFIAADLADLAALSLLPAQFEHKFGPFIVDIEETSLRVEGKIDRIDEGGGKYRIIDYKSGKALRHVKLADKIDRGVRLQLALYAMAAASFVGAPVSNVSGAIKPIAGAAKPGDFAFELAGKETRLRETLALFVAAIRRGDFPAFPNEDDNDFNACKYCPVNHSCRTRHDAEEKRAVLRSGEPRTLLQEAGS
ncbi:MAG TPA: PD-(D/E)XK nuclease family protein [Thermoanaerobaculia bacterium]